MLVSGSAWSSQKTDISRSTSNKIRKTDANLHQGKEVTQTKLIVQTNE